MYNEELVYLASLGLQLVDYQAIELQVVDTIVEQIVKNISGVEGAYNQNFCIGPLRGIPLCRNK
jgi:hypothetical protein